MKMTSYVLVACVLLVAGCDDAPVAVQIAPAPPKTVDGGPVAKEPPVKPATPEVAVVAAAIDGEVGQPATIAEAAKVLDLATFPLMPGVAEAGKRVTASLTYEAPGTLKDVFEFQRRTLLDRQWKELSEPQIYEQSASGEFGKDGYHLSVSVIARGEAGKVAVFLQNHGNLNLSKLPVPTGAKLQYSFPAVTSFETTASVEETAAAVKQLLLDQGWHVYGSAGDVMSFKKNAVHLDARVLAPPAQPGKTVIDYSARLMSADLPAPAGGEHIQYADNLKQLNLHAPGKPDDVAAWYQKALEPAGWRATTERPIHDGVESFMIFRNPAKDMLTLNMWDLRAEKKVRVTLNHESAAEVEHLEQKADEMIAARKKKEEEDRNKPKPKAAFSLPSSANDVKVSKTEIEFHVATGKGKAAVDEIVKQLSADGWKAETPIGDNMAGQLSLEKEGQSVKILYVDPGFIPAQITVTGWGAELVRLTNAKK